MEDLADRTVDCKETARRGINILAHWVGKVHIPWKSIDIRDNFIVNKHSVGMAITFHLVEVDLKGAKGCVD